MKILRKHVSVFLILVLVATVLSGCNVQPAKEFREMSDFENATLGILSGSSFDPLAKECFPNARRQYYSLVPDMIRWRSL